MTLPVQLYRYDMTNGMARSMSMMLIGRQLEGIWHTSIVVYGREFYFDGGIGISSERPGSTRFGTPYSSEELGTTGKTEAEFIAWAQHAGGSRFRPDSYNLLGNNCNHFTSAASQFLLGRDIPADVRDMIPLLLSTPLGRIVQPMLESLAGNAAGAGEPIRTTNAPAVSSTPPPCRGLLSPKQTLSADEEEDLMVAMALLESNELVADGTSVSGCEAALKGLDLLLRVLNNIIEDPMSSKYRALSTGTQAYTKYLRPLETFGVLEILRLTGFRRRPHPDGTWEQWFLCDTMGSLGILQQVADVLTVGRRNIAATIGETQTSSMCTEAAKDTRQKEDDISKSSGVGAPFTALFLRLPCSSSYRPLPVGEEEGSPLYSICYTPGKHGTSYFGRCRLTEAHEHEVACYYSEMTKENSCSSDYTVLCVAAGTDDAVVWVPTFLLKKYSATPATFGDPELCNVLRVPSGRSIIPGVMYLDGRCVVPYGGKALEVTDSTEFLCFKERMPAPLLEALAFFQKGRELYSLWERRHGLPLCSFRELLRWSPPAGCTPASPLRSRLLPEPSHGSRRSKLLVCHDMRGGYLAGDYPFFSAEKGTPVPDEAYTIRYWQFLDYFVYFSHQSVTIPPRAWIDEGHRHGVPVLGTIITEGVKGWEEMRQLLTDATHMAAVVRRLVLLCDTYGFDGYLLNVESSVDRALVRRLVYFCSMLRNKLQKTAAHRIIIWYDAVNIDGLVNYQNALTVKNEPFFDACDGIFTNYFWRPDDVVNSSHRATNRRQDVFVGVDVWGRSMFAGGKYNTHKAQQVAVSSGLSVALFAPAWTLEAEGRGRRDRFLWADSKLWANLQIHHSAYEPELTMATLPAWTAFLPGVGKCFYLNGVPTGDGPGCTWCQISRSHRPPSMQFVAQQSENDLQERCLLSVVSPAGAVEGHVQAEWLTNECGGGGNAVWFGTRSLLVDIPPGSAVQLIGWRVRSVSEGVRALLETSSPGSRVTMVVDIAWHVSASDHHATSCHGPRSIRVHTTTAGGVSSSIDIAEPVKTGVGCRSEHARSALIFESGEWCVARYIVNEWISSTAGMGHVITDVTSVSVMNPSSTAAISCLVGGIGVHTVLSKECLGSAHAFTASSPLVVPSPFTWPDEHVKMYGTYQSHNHILHLDGCQDMLKPREAGMPHSFPPPLRTSGEPVTLAFVATITGENLADVATTYLGQHTIGTSDSDLLIPLRAPSASLVKSVQCYVIAGGF